MTLDESIDSWCRSVLGAGIAKPIFSGSHVSTVRAERLSDARPPADSCAGLLATVIAAAPRASTVPALAPPPPWVWWDHQGRGLWPAPDDLDVDLNSVASDEWLDDAARRIRGTLRRHRGVPVAGHVDWEAHNIGWRGQLPVVIYDWDSLASRPEPAVVGAAATVFGSMTGMTVAASVSETNAFLDSYQRRRGLFDAEDLRVAWAAGLWTLLHNAKKETAGGGAGYLQLLEDELEDRRQHAGL